MKIKIKNIIILGFLMINFMSVFADNSENEGELKKFIVTAYYSPTIDQSIYLKWNYESEIALNGEWIKWASWKDVYSWMLAAPKTYSFWTKIYLDWIWIWTVDDRWWAIVWSWSRGYDWDRIDIWMWYWENGLKRALTWWKREIYWKIINNEDTSDYSFIDLEKFKIWKISLRALKNDVFVWINSGDTVIPDKIGKNSNETDIKKIQEILKNLWFYDWDIDWKYSRFLIDAIADFQISNNLVKSSFEPEAWFFWPKTKEILKSNYSKYLTEASERKKQELAQQKILSLVSKKSEQIVSSFWNPKINEIWQHVRKLQKTLKLLWYFNSKDTAIFWIQTQESLINYQLKKWIIKSKDDFWAWKLDENTKRILENDIKDYLVVNNDLEV